MLPRLVFINRFFIPDASATSKLLADLAFCMVEHGYEVEVIASRQSTAGRAKMLPAHERIGGVLVHRVGPLGKRRTSLIGRLWDCGLFYFASSIKLLQVAKRGDVVIAKTDPPMLSVIVAAIARIRGITVVNWLQDIYPEVAAALGVPGLRGPIGHALKWLRNSSLRSAFMNVAIGEEMKAVLRKCGVEEAKLTAVPNWASNEEIQPLEADANPLRKAWSLQEKFVVGYSGTLGRSHDFETALGAARRLEFRSDIVFLVVGGGYGFERFKRAVEKRGCKNIQFHSFQPEHALPATLAAPDLHWLSLKSGLDGLVLPSKFYGIAAAGRPMLMIGAPGGELARLVEEYACGASIRLGDSDTLASAIAALADDISKCRLMGINARQMLERRFTKSQAIAKWSAVLDAAATYAHERSAATSRPWLRRSPEGGARAISYSHLERKPIPSDSTLADAKSTNTGSRSRREFPN